MNAKLGVLLSMQQFQVMNKKRMPTAGLEPTQILVKHIYNLVEKLQLRPPIGRGLKHQFVTDPVSYTKQLLLVTFFDTTAGIGNSKVGC